MSLFMATINMDKSVKLESHCQFLLNFNEHKSKLTGKQHATTSRTPESSIIVDFRPHLDFITQEGVAMASPTVLKRRTILTYKNLNQYSEFKVMLAWKHVLQNRVSYSSSSTN